MNKFYPIAIAAVAVSAAGGWWYAKHRAPEAPHHHQLVKQTTPEGKSYFTCPMHPEVRQDSPGQCPICGMKLVERHDSANSVMDAGAAAQSRADNGHAGGMIVSIDPRIAQNLGMRTAPVEDGRSLSTIEATGRVAIDERRVVAIEARAPGWVERLDIHSVGEVVRRGQAVAAIYAPDLMAGSEELALARKIGDPGMIEAARTRLSLLGVTESAKGAQQRVAITAPQDGVVTEIVARQGAQVMPGTPLMKIADLSTVWVLIDVPEGQASSIHIGGTARAEFPAIPNRSFTGQIDYLYPSLDSQTRTLQARLVFDNADAALKPGMYGKVQLSSGTAVSTLQVPSEAVIRTGGRNIVLVAEAEGRYHPVEVTLGAESRDRITVIAGLSAGQRVVTSGQFLIDSEASLLGAYDRMGTEP